MKVSVVTPVLNRADLIGEAIESVLAQKGVEVEHIVVDGGSTDGTIDRIGNYGHVRFVSLPGSRPEEALNEGIRLATGDIVGFVMSDDRLGHAILARVVAAFDSDRTIDIISTGAGFFTVDDGHEVVLKTLRRQPVIEFNYRTVLLGPLLACARFYRRRIFDAIGLFHTKYPMCNDRDFLWRALMAKCSNVCIEEIGYWYRSHSGSRSIGVAPEVKLQIAEEHLRMAADYLQAPDIPPLYRRWLRRFHSVECARALVRNLLAGSAVTAGGLLVRAFRVDPLWPVVVAREFGFVLLARVRSR